MSGYDSNVSGELTIEPPLTGADIDSALRDVQAALSTSTFHDSWDLHLVQTTAPVTVDGEQLTRRSAVKLAAPYEHGGMYELGNQIETWVEVLAGMGRTVAGQIVRDGADLGDLERW